MPSWPIHIALANKINKKLKLGDSFIIGNVLPDYYNGYIIDTPNKLDKKTTHYYNKELENYDKFLKENKENIKNPLFLGYYAHLFTDSFYNKYFHQKHLLKKDDKYILILNDGKTINKKNPWELKQQDFYNYGNYLINNTSFILSNINTEKLPFNLKKDDINKITNKINDLFKSQNKEDKYLVFTKEELNNLFENCYKELLSKINYLLK